MATHSVTATTLKEGLNKFGQKSDEIISAIPFPLYFLLCLVAVGAVGQATYDYYHQEPYINLSQKIIIDLNSPIIESSGIKVCDSYSIQTPVSEAICYDADLFYSSGKLEVKK